MTRKNRGLALAAGALTGFGLNGLGAYVMNILMPHGGARKPVWHEDTIGLTPTTLAVGFVGLLMLAALFALAAESERSSVTFMKFTAAFVVIWAFVGNFV